MFQEDIFKSGISFNNNKLGRIHKDAGQKGFVPSIKGQEGGANITTRYKVNGMDLLSIKTRKQFVDKFRIPLRIK